MSRLDVLAKSLGIAFFDYQLKCFDWLMNLRSQSHERACLYYKTGAGKSITALVMLALLEHEEALVITPPSTFKDWEVLGEKVGIKVHTMSHAKFRMKDTRLAKDMAVVADEMHLFGGHSGKGWKKLDRLAAGLQAPLIMASATPNYNDADRVYCIQHILDPNSCRGGFLEFIYKNCTTEQNPFGMMPNVTGFLHFADAAEYLAALPGVMYLPDDLVYQIHDYPIAEKIPQEMEDFGYNRRKNKIIASGIEDKHDRIALSLIDAKGHVYPDVFDFVDDKITTAVESVLIFAAHSTVARALSSSLREHDIEHGLVTGDTSPKRKQEIIDQFRDGEIEILIGTASLATGTDGMDKVCDTLIIVDDTEDPSLRRQLIGRIMPRGKAASAAHKQVYRLVLQP